MKNPIDIGSKTIDAANVHLIRELTPERLASINTDKNFTVEIRALGGEGGFVEKLSLAQIVDFFASKGEPLRLVKSAGEAVRTDWMTNVKDFSSREGQPNKFHSVATFKHPANGATAEEWLAAKRSDISPHAPKLSDIGGGPR